MTSPRTLREWCRLTCARYPDVEVRNMSGSFRDGLVFCAIIHRHRPDLIDFISLSKVNIYYNNKLAFEIAETKLGIPALLDPNDMVSSKDPDGLSIITYVSQFYHLFTWRAPAGPVSLTPSHVAILNTLTKSKSPAALRAPKSSSELKHSREETSVLTPGAVCSLACSLCLKPVHLIQRRWVEGKLYHRRCFRCKVCHSSLLAGSFTRGREAGFLFCTHHLTESQSPRVDLSPDTQPAWKLQDGSSSAGRSSLNSVPHYAKTTEAPDGPVHEPAESEERDSTELAAGLKRAAKKPARCHRLQREAGQAADDHTRQQGRESFSPSSRRAPVTRSCPVPAPRRMLDPSAAPVTAPSNRPPQTPDGAPPSEKGNEQEKSSCSHTSSRVSPKVRTNHPWLHIVHPGPWTLLPPAPPPVPAPRTRFSKRCCTPRIVPPNPFAEEFDEEAQSDFAVSAAQSAGSDGIRAAVSLNPFAEDMAEDTERADVRTDKSGNKRAVSLNPFAEYMAEDTERADVRTDKSGNKRAVSLNPFAEDMTEDTNTEGAGLTMLTVACVEPEIEGDVTDKSVNEGGVTDKSVNEGDMTDKSVNEGGVTDKSGNEGDMTDKSVNEGDVTDKSVNEGGVTDKSVNEGGVTDKSVNEGGVTDKSGNEGDMTDKSVNEGDVTDKSGNKGGVTDKSGNEGEVTDQSGNKHAVSLNTFTEDMTEDTNTEGADLTMLTVACVEPGIEGDMTDKSVNEGGVTDKSGNEGDMTDKSGNEGGVTDKSVNEGGVTDKSVNEGGVTDKSGNEGDMTDKSGNKHAVSLNTFTEDMTEDTNTEGADLTMLTGACVEPGIEGDMTDKSVSEGDVTDKSVNEGDVTDKSGNEGEATYKSGNEGDVTDKSGNEGDVTDKSGNVGAVPLNTFAEDMTEDTNTECADVTRLPVACVESGIKGDMTDKSVSEGKVTDKSGNEVNVTDKSVSEGKVTDKSGNAGGVTDKSGKVGAVPLNTFAEDMTEDTNTECADVTMLTVACVESGIKGDMTDKSVSQGKAADKSGNEVNVTDKSVSEGKVTDKSGNAGGVTDKSGKVGAVPLNTFAEDMTEDTNTECADVTMLTVACVESGIKGDMTDKSVSEGKVTDKSGNEVDVTDKSGNEGGVSDKSVNEGGVIDKSGNEVGVTDKSANVVEVTDKSGNEGEVTDKSGNEVGVTHKSGNLGYVTDKSGNEGEATYKSGNVGDETDKSGNEGDVTDKSGNVGAVPLNTFAEDMTEDTNTECADVTMLTVACVESGIKGDMTDKSVSEGKVTDKLGNDVDVSDKSGNEGGVSDKSVNEGGVIDKSGNEVGVTDKSGNEVEVTDKSANVVEVTDKSGNEVGVTHKSGNEGEATYESGNVGDVTDKSGNVRAVPLNMFAEDMTEDTNTECAGLTMLTVACVESGIKGDMTDKSVSQGKAADKSGNEGGVTDKSGNEGGVTDKSVNEGDVTDKSVSECKVTDKSRNEGEVTDKSGNEGEVTDKSGNEGEVTHKSGNEGEVTDKSGNVGAVPLNTFAEDMTEDTNTECADVTMLTVACVESGIKGDMTDKSVSEGDVTDKSGNEVEVTDKSANVVGVTDKSGNEVDVTDKSGNEVEVTHKSGNLGYVTDKSGNEVEVTHKSGNEGDVTDKSGNVGAVPLNVFAEDMTEDTNTECAGLTMLTVACVESGIKGDMTDKSVSEGDVTDKSWNGGAVPLNTFAEDMTEDTNTEGADVTILTVACVESGNEGEQLCSGNAGETSPPAETPEVGCDTASIPAEGVLAVMLTVQTSSEPVGESNLAGVTSLRASLQNVNEAAAWPCAGSDEAQTYILPRSLSVPAISSSRCHGSSLCGDLTETSSSQSKLVCSENPFNRNHAMSKSKTCQSLPSRRGPAPGHGFPLIRRKVQTDKNVSTEDLRVEMSELDKHLQTLEQRGVELERTLRESRSGKEEEEMLSEWFSLVHETNVVVRRDTELVHLTKQQKLEERQADVEYGLRCLLNKPEGEWSDKDRGEEQQLMDELVAIIEQRNQIVSSLDQDRLREREEDLYRGAVMKDKEKEELKDLKKSKSKFKPSKVFKMLNHKKNDA